MINTIRLETGASVDYGGEKCRILTPIGTDKYMLQKSDGTHLAVGISDIVGATGPSEPDPQPTPPSHFSCVSPEKLETARRQHAILKPLVHKPDRKAIEVAQVAAQLDMTPRNAYRLLRKLEISDSPDAIVPSNRGVEVGTRRLRGASEDLIDEAIRSVFLTRVQRPITDVHFTVARSCHADGVRPPAYNTVRKRIKALDPADVMAKRFGSKAARQRFVPRPGKFPGGDYPGAVVQLDHTLPDIQLVAGENRLPVGTRPTLTIAIDVFTRMILGIYLGYDPPSFSVTGICIAHAILPKDDYLKRLGLTDSTWPYVGVMNTLHTDNGTDFWSDNLDRACEAYGINRIHRPVATPNFGGHVERFFKTLNDELHKLPGSTFSNSRDRGDYHSEKMATLTLDEALKFIVLFITGVYHKRVHSGLGCSPERMLEKALAGENGVPPTWHRRVAMNERKTRLDWLPNHDAVVQRIGVRRKNIFYWHPVLRDHIGVKRSFKVDFRCISPIFYFDEVRNDYVDVHYADSRLPSMSESERITANKLARVDGRVVNQYDIFKKHDEMERIVANASADKKMKWARKRSERAKCNRNSRIGLEAPTPIATIDTPTGSVSAQSNVVPLRRTEKLAPFDGEEFA
jgi:putative transposase